MELKELNIDEKKLNTLISRDYISVEALVRREPLHYYDFSKCYSLDRNNTEFFSKVSSKIETAIIGKCIHVEQTFKNKRSLIKIRIREKKTENLLFINIIGQYRNFEKYESCLNHDVIAGGIIAYSEEYKSFSMMNPIVFSMDISSYNRIYPVYGTISNIPDDYFKEKLHDGIEHVGLLDFIPPQTLKRYGIPSFKQSAMMMHYPKSIDELQRSKKRAVFEDLLYLAVKLELQNLKNKICAGLCFPKNSCMHDFLNNLPYKLTKDQQNAIQSLYSKMQSGLHVNALIQGDVGTGKTLVAEALLLAAAENGYQGVLLAPYTTLATQHYSDMKQIAEKYGFKAVLLTSESKTSEKKKIQNMIASGEANIVIGTHSVFANAVTYHNLGLIITDEEHKFGVVHREHIREKATGGYHQITMSATPIPRSLAETIYGDHVEVITILDKPAGRIPVQTAVCRNDITAMNHLLKELKAGHQAYVVCPSIQKNEKSTSSISEKEPIYRSFFEPYGFHIGVVTGKTKSTEKNRIMEDFKQNKIQILMATTVIEVGINVPNATCIVISGADRFGFSTLHQLRGRVGRGNLKSYCILQTDSANVKLDYMCQENDGFKIAMKDLELRGPGSLFGEKQTGNDYYVKLMLTYPNMYKKIKEEAKRLCTDNTGKDMVERYEKLFIKGERET